MAQLHTSADQLVGQNLEHAYKMAQKETLRKATHGDKRSIPILERRYKNIKDRLRNDFYAQRTLEYQQKLVKLRRKQKFNKILRFGVRVTAAATVTTAIVLSAGAGFLFLGSMSEAEKWVRSWSNDDRNDRERLQAEYNSADERDFTQYLESYGLNEEDVAELLSIDRYDSDSEGPQPRKSLCS